MRSTITRVSALLLGIGVLLAGSGLLGTLLGVRAALAHFPAAVIGLIMAAYFLGYVVGTYLCPALIKGVGHIRTFAVLAAVASAAAITHAVITDALVWAVLRFVTGICLVGLYMVVESWLNTQSDRLQRGRLFAVYIAVTLLALAAGQWLMLLDDASFLPFAIASVLFSLGLIPVALTRVREPAPISVPRMGLHRLYRTSPLSFIGVSITGIVSSAFWALGPVFAQRTGFSTAGIAAFMGATILGGAVLQWPIGHLSDNFDRRNVLLGVCVAAELVALSSLVPVALSSGAGLALCAFIYGGLAFSVYPLCVAHMNDHLTPDDVLEATSGLLMIYGIGATAGPVLAGLWMTASQPLALLQMFAVCHATLALFTVYRRHVRLPVVPEAQGAFVPMVRTSPAALEMHPSQESDVLSANETPGQ